ncbi:hypothetical protein COCCADRAFT_88507, partial [Bipolaris zeicola 26-R-13]
DFVVSGGSTTGHTPDAGTQGYGKEATTTADQLFKSTLSLWAKLLLHGLDNHMLV